jgi:inorganic pyrophosphatase
MPDLTSFPNNLDTKTRQCLAIIESPKNSRSKFNYDPDSNLFKLARLLPEGMSFPFDFGFIPSTQGQDGDPLDVLVLMDEPAHVGCLMDVRLVGVFEAGQTEAGKTERNDRLLAVAVHSYSHEDVFSIADVGKTRLGQIENFFVSYNALHGKKFKVTKRGGPQRAVSLVKEGIKLFKDKEKE